MQTRVDVDVIDLVVVLNEGRPKQAAGKREVNFGANQNKIRIGIRLCQLYPVVTKIEAQNAKGVHAVVDHALQITARAIEILPKPAAEFNINQFARIGQKIEAKQVIGVTTALGQRGSPRIGGVKSCKEVDKIAS